jgi:hypothetical protein
MPSIRGAPPFSNIITRSEFCRKMVILVHLLSNHQVSKSWRFFTFVQFDQMFSKTDPFTVSLGQQVGDTFPTLAQKFSATSQSCNYATSGSQLASPSKMDDFVLFFAKLFRLCQ